MAINCSWKEKHNASMIFLDHNKHQKQMALYQDVTEYVRKGFNTAKRTKKQFNWVNNDLVSTIGK